MIIIVIFINVFTSLLTPHLIGWNFGIAGIMVLIPGLRLTTPIEGSGLSKLVWESCL